MPDHLVVIAQSLPGHELDNLAEALYLPASARGPQAIHIGRPKQVFGRLGRYAAAIDDAHSLSYRFSVGVPKPRRTSQHPAVTCSGGADFATPIVHCGS